MRRIAWILCCLMLLTAFACAAAEEETAYAPLFSERGRAQLS